MKIAVDRHGTLTQKGVREIVKLLAKAGCEIHVISHVHNSTPEKDEQAKQAILRLCERHSIPVTSISASNYPAKSDRMRELGCRLLLDDNPNIVQEVESHDDLMGICVRHPWAYIAWIGRRLGLTDNEPATTRE